MSRLNTTRKTLCNLSQRNNQVVSGISGMEATLPMQDPWGKTTKAFRALSFKKKPRKGLVKTGEPRVRFSRVLAENQCSRSLGPDYA